MLARNILPPAYRRSGFRKGGGQAFFPPGKMASIILYKGSFFFSASVRKSKFVPSSFFPFPPFHMKILICIFGVTFFFFSSSIFLKTFLFPHLPSTRDVGHSFASLSEQVVLALLKLEELRVAAFRGTSDGAPTTGFLQLAPRLPFHGRSPALSTASAFPFH